ncbi:MAG TPA: hypothetical protein VNS09_01125 [Solirubrobacter sp.]|nr:hypothetical protein [Solirubrobacter sp.]
MVLVVAQRPLAGVVGDAVAGALVIVVCAGLLAVPVVRHWLVRAL